MEKLHHLLAKGNCPAEMDRQGLTLSYSKQYESEVCKAIGQLKTEYQIEIDDVPQNLPLPR